MLFGSSVELNFVYQVGGCGMTLTEINDAIPHTWIDMEYRGAYKIHLAHSLHKKWVLFVVPQSWNYHISYLGQKRKHFRICLLGDATQTPTKLENFRFRNNTRVEYRKKLLNLWNIVFRVRIFERSILCFRRKLTTDNGTSCQMTCGRLTVNLFGRKVRILERKNESTLQDGLF